MLQEEIEIEEHRIQRERRISMQQSTVESNYSASVSVSLNGDETDSDPRTALEREIKFKTFVSKNTCIKYI